MKLICTFTTGRTGTGYISQLFGGKYSKKAIHLNDGMLITHESWPDLKYLVEYIKKNGYNEDGYIEKKFIEHYNGLKKEYNFNSYFITDHRIGRYLVRSLPNIDIKIIRIKKEHSKIAKSFIKRFEKVKDAMPHKYNKFYEDLWTKSFYHPDDKFILTSPEKLWSDMSDIERLSWYCKETDKRWLEVRNILSPNQYIEIEFDDLFEKEPVEELSLFLGIKYSEYNFKKAANK